MTAAAYAARRAAGGRRACPRPAQTGEREGKEKRARTRYTDYLTPAPVFAQEVEQKVRRADPPRWKKDSRYRFLKREEIFAEAVSMLPAFATVGDMPAGIRAEKKGPAPLSLSQYVESHGRSGRC